MATATNPNPTSTSAVLDNFYTETEDVVVGLDVSKDKEGKVTKNVNVYSVGSDKKKGDLQKAVEAKEFEPLVQFTTRTTYPKTFEGLVESVASSPEKQSEALNNHNRGAGGKVANRLKAIVAKAVEVDDAGVGKFDESILTADQLDLTDQIYDPPKRLSLTEEEKFDRFLAGMSLSDEKKNQMKAIWKASQ